VAENNANSMNEIVVVIAKSDQNALGSVRCIPAIRAAVEGDLVWVRTGTNAVQLDSKIRQLPAQKSYTVDEDGRLFPINALTPTGKIPALDFVPISEFVTVEMPTSAIPATVQEKHKVSLVVSANVQNGDALFTSLETWKNYAEGAPEIRLSRLCFAVSETNDVLVMGNPLPPIPGQEFWLNENVLLPCGYDFKIPLLAKTIARKLGADDDMMVLFDKDGAWDHILHSSFAPALRSAIRLTKGGDDA
jgi:hypothetical protein